MNMRVKRVMRSNEERYNESKVKEEHLEYNREEANEVKILGSSVGKESDAGMRTKRASGL